MTLRPVKKWKTYLDQPKAIILLLWILINGFLLIRNGIIATGEAGKYIDEAHSLLTTGTLSSSNYWLYFTQIFLLAICLKSGFGFGFAVIVQLLFNLFSTFSFYKILQYAFKSNRTAIVGTIILLLNLVYQEFNTYLQTESLFYSLTLIYTCYLLHIEKPSLKSFAIIVAYLAVLMITRPTGLLFLPATFIYLFYTFFKKMLVGKKIILSVLILILFFYILNNALGSGGELDFLRPFREENIICGVSTIAYNTVGKTGERNDSIFGLFYYITHNFSQFSRLGLAKTWAFFGLYRSYYSTVHNISLIVYFYTLHLLALSSIFYWLKNYRGIFIYLFSVIFLAWLTVILTCDDWHNRFYLAISPYLIILGLAALNRMMNISSNRNRQKL